MQVVVYNAEDVELDLEDAKPILLNLNEVAPQDDGCFLIYFFKNVEIGDVIDFSNNEDDSVKFGFDNLQPHSGFDNVQLKTERANASNYVVDQELKKESLPVDYSDAQKTEMEQLVSTFQPSVLNHYKLIDTRVKGNSDSKYYVAPWVFVPRDRDFSCALTGFLLPKAGKTMEDIKAFLAGEKSKVITIKTSNDDHLKVSWHDTDQTDKTKITYHRLLKKYKNNFNLKPILSINIGKTTDDSVQKERTETIEFRSEENYLLGQICLKVEDTHELNLIHFTAQRSSSVLNGYILNQTMEQDSQDPKYIEADDNLKKVKKIFETCGIVLNYNNVYEFMSGVTNLGSSLEITTENDSDKIEDVLTPKLVSSDIKLVIKNGAQPVQQIASEKYLYIVHWPERPGDLSVSTHGVSWKYSNIALYWPVGNPALFGKFIYKTIVHELGHALGLPHTFREDDEVQNKTNIGKWFVNLAHFNNVQAPSTVEEELEKFFSNIRTLNILHALKLNSLNPNDANYVNDINRAYYGVITPYLFEQHKTHNWMDYMKLTIVRTPRQDQLGNVNGYDTRVEIDNIRYEFYVFQWDILRLRSKLLYSIP